MENPNDYLYLPAIVSQQFQNQRGLSESIFFLSTYKDSRVVCVMNNFQYCIFLLHLNGEIHFNINLFASFKQISIITIDYVIAFTVTVVTEIKIEVYALLRGRF